MDKDLLLYGYNDDFLMGDDDIGIEEDETIPDGETMQPEDDEEEDFE